MVLYLSSVTLDSNTSFMLCNLERTHSSCQVYYWLHKMRQIDSLPLPYGLSMSCACPFHCISQSSESCLCLVPYNVCVAVVIISGKCFVHQGVIRVIPTKSNLRCSPWQIFCDSGNYFPPKKVLLWRHQYDGSSGVQHFKRGSKGKCFLSRASVKENNPNV